MHAAIFDIDGTLLQTDASDDVLFLQSVHEALGNLKIRPSWSLYTQFTAAGIVEEILRDNDIEATERTVASVRDRFIEGVRQYTRQHGPFPEVPGAVSYVNGLHASATHRIAYATGGWGGAARLKLWHAGFPLDQVPLASSDDHFERPQIMLRALALLQGQFETITYYGDGHWDAQAAKSLGWGFVPVGRKLGGLEEFATHAA